MEFPMHLHPPIQASETRDWTSLPGDLLIVVAGKLTSLADFSSIRRVCSSWRSYVIPSVATLASQSPLVILHVQNRLLMSFDVVFLDVTRGRYYKTEYRTSWRSFNLLNCSHGYLAMAFGNGRILLTHIFTKDKIWLTKTCKPFSDTKNIIFSENPSSPQGCFALYSSDSSTVEFCQHRDSSWKSGILYYKFSITDMAFFQGKLYALLCYNGSTLLLYLLAVVDFTPSFTFQYLGPAVLLPDRRRPYLFTSQDELLLSCSRLIGSWDFEHDRWTWKSSFDGRALLLSKNQLTVCVVNPPHHSWIKASYKYFYDMSCNSLTRR